MPSKNNIYGWLRFGLAVFCVVTGAIVFVWRSQAAQDVEINDNHESIEVFKTEQRNLTENVGKSIDRMNGNIIALSAQVSNMGNAIVRIETLQAAQREDIRELKGR